MNKSRVGVWAVGVALLVCALPISWTWAGYSSGKSSVSHSSSASHRSSSSSSSSSHNSSSSHSSSHSSGYSSGKGSSFSSGKSNTSGASAFGSTAAAAKRQEESHPSGTHFSASPSPIPTSNNPLQIPAPPSAANQRNRQMAYLRSHLNSDSYASRSYRTERFFGDYLHRPMPAIIYHDNYNPWFWMWLLDRPAHQQADWAYHHRYAMDSARYDQLIQDNTLLQQRVTELENQHLARDPAYVPADLPDGDLMYADPIAAAATQPVVAPPPENEHPLVPENVESPIESPRVQSSPTVTYTDQSILQPYGPVSSSGSAPLIGGLFFLVFFGVLAATVISVINRVFRDSSQGNSQNYASIPMPVMSQRSTNPSAPDQLMTMDNPLNLLAGQTITLNLPDFAGLNFTVDQIQHYTTRVGEQSFQYTAYWAIPNSPFGESQRVQLRVERLASGDLAVLALQIHEEFEYSQDFFNIVETDRTGLFQITDDNTGAVTAEYYRPEGVLTGYQATIATQSARDQSIATQQIQYWDYSRQIDTPQGTVAEYLIVEMKSTSGRFRILRGPQVNATVVQA